MSLRSDAAARIEVRCGQLDASCTGVGGPCVGPRVEANAEVQRLNDCSYLVIELDDEGIVAANDPFLLPVWGVEGAAGQVHLPAAFTILKACSIPISRLSVRVGFSVRGVQSAEVASKITR